jgi:6-phosphofructokinase 1
MRAPYHRFGSIAPLFQQACYRLDAISFLVGSTFLMTLRVGILTSGGDAPGMNAVIAAACDRVERGCGQALGIPAGFAGLAGGGSLPIAANEARAHAHEPGTWLGTSRWPALAEPGGRQACRDALAALAVDALLVIGGDGSAKGACALADALPVAFVPATIDHDIAGTEASIGMDSAIGYALDVIDRLWVTGRALRGRAFLVQTLGAPSGYLADAVAAAAGIEEALVPERPFDLRSVAGRLRERAPDGTAIAVMSEAVGDAVSIAAALAEHAAVRVHATILGHAQRAATPSARDRSLADAAGRAAVEWLADGRSAFVGLDARGIAKPAPLTPASDREGTRR